jgi:prepilin-type N-terminal cleavage/methylation domain-containing protein
MKNTKRKVLKGLTLIELIVVMAIFSILLVGIMAFFQPVERIFKNTAISEKTYSYANNIEELIETKLKYTDAVWIFNSSKVDGTGFMKTADGMTDDEELTAISEAFANMYYKDVFLKTSEPGGASTEAYAKGKVHIMHLINDPANIPSSSVPSDFVIGQIGERTVDFTSDPTQSKRLTSSLAAESNNDLIINKAYFKAGDAKYNYHYSLGAGRLVNPPVAPGTNGETYRAVDNDMNDADLKIAYDNLNLCVVTTSNEPGVGTTHLSSGGFNYLGFLNPCTLSVANLPLMNIVYGGGRTSNRVCRTSPTAAAGATAAPPAFYKQGDATHTPPEAFKVSGGGNDYIDTSINFDDDIYFIFSYADELTT